MLDTRQSKVATSPQRDVKLDFDDLGTRLLEYAHRRAIRTGWHLDANGALALGETVEDIVNDALLTLVDPDTRRHWYSAQTPDPFDYLKSAVNSSLDHLRDKVTRRQAERAVGGDETSSPIPGPAQLLEEREQLEAVRRATVRLQEVVNADPELQAIYEAFENDITKPADIAVLMDASVDHVNNLLKRFRRRWQDSVLEEKARLRSARGTHG